MNNEGPQAGNPQTQEDRYRLYIDESGDHVFRDFGPGPQHRYLCLLGCWFAGQAYRDFHEKLEAFKQQHIPHSPDEPVILHREDIVGRRRAFWRLREPSVADRFDTDLLKVLQDSRFTMVAIVIDKAELQAQYATPAHPYHLALGFLLQRYCGLLNHINRRGDVMAESRGGKEDRTLKASYEWVYQRGAWQQRSEFFQRALTSKELKLKSKPANIAGLQLADLLAHPVRQMILHELRLDTRELSEFERRLSAAVTRKFNRHLYDGRVWGYGKVIFPKQEQEKAP